MFNLVPSKCLRDLLRVYGPKSVSNAWQTGCLHLGAPVHHCSDSSHGERLPSECYVEIFPRLKKLSSVLQNVDLVDGKLVDVNSNSTVHDDRLYHRMHRFKAFFRSYLGCPLVQEAVLKNINSAFSGKILTPPVCFTKLIERDPMSVNNLTKVCNFLNISAQQRKVVRYTISPQVTQHRIWTGALEEVLNGLKTDMELLDPHSLSNGAFMGQQIASTCLKFLASTACRVDDDASSWMRPKPSKIVRSPSSSHTWKEVLEMFNDLINSLKHEERLAFHVAKLEAMKEGLAQIRDVVIDRDIGYKDVRYHENLVQKKLVKTLGHPSRCLFTLLRYYLHRTTRDMEVEVSGGLCEFGYEDKLCLYMGKTLTSDNEKMVSRGVRQLDQALGLFKFVWDTAKVERKLELQGHLWCIGAESKTVTYRGNLFFLHGINP